MGPHYVVLVTSAAAAAAIKRAARPKRRRLARDHHVRLFAWVSRWLRRRVAPQRD